mmetsp:Transcript_5373/g.11733  ORF Transcript_5373/g.11733 Transcript_5373/m.11733 type:complete len:81 (-) Transcript_5373:128-370(-)
MAPSSSLRVSKHVLVGEDDGGNEEDGVVDGRDVVEGAMDGPKLIDGMADMTLEHDDAQKGPPSCSVGSPWKVHPESVNVS